MILRTEEVTQPIDGRDSRRFIKEIVYVSGAQPLGMVRKRLPPTELRGPYLAPVLLIHGFGQNRYAWHLSGRSFVNYLARQGFDVFNVDFRGHGRSRRYGSRNAECIDDYIREDLPAALAEVLALSGAARAFVVGHSMGGMIAAAAAPRLRESLAGLVMIGSPYRFARGSATLMALARLVGALDTRVLRHVATSTIPVRTIGTLLRVQRVLWDSNVVPLPVRAWAPGAIEPPLLVEYLRNSFDAATFGTLAQMSRLALEERFVSRDGREDYGEAFEALEMPLLVIAGARDLLAPPPSVRPAYERSRSSDKTYQEISLGHADLLLGRAATRSVWPLVSSWMHARIRAKS